MGTKPVVVRGGDYMTAIAYRNGTTVDDILAEPKNAALLKKRPNPEILAPLDVVYVPICEPLRHPLTVGSNNTFVANVPKVTVRVVLIGGDGKPLAGKTVTTDPVFSKDPTTTDGSGLLTLSVSVLVRTITVVVQDVGIQFQLRVGNLDPHDESSGLLSRLRQLDYLGNEGEHVAARPWLADYADEADAHTIRKGIQAFQDANGDDVTGEVDDDVCGAIRDEHGC